jgi:dTDP-4-dehydrorhamnose 3,5-epimerase-like enzyme
MRNTATKKPTSTLSKPAPPQPFGTSFGSAYSKLGDLHNLYGGLDDAAPPKPPRSTSKPAFGAPGIGGKARAPSSKVIPGQPPHTLGRKAPMASLALTGTKASMDRESIKQFVEMLKGLREEMPADLAKFAASKLVVDKAKLRLYNFSEEPKLAGLQRITDEVVHQQCSSMMEVKDLIPAANLKSHITPDNLNQGQVGDCYILGSLSVLADQPALIDRLLQEEENGKYEVLLCDSGSWKSVRVDSRFPVNTQGRLLYATSKNNCIWQMVMEKAFACLYKGYQMLELGHSSVALRELTGCATEYIELADPPAAWAKIQSALAQGFVITGSSRLKDLSSDHITPKHCYALLDARQVTVANKPVRYVLLKNPISHSNSPPALHKEAAQQLAKPATSDMFWHQFAHVLKDFEVLTCCKIKPLMDYSWATVDNSGQKRACSVFACAARQGDLLTVSFNHKNIRHFMKQNLDSIMKTKYGVARIIAFRFGQGSTIELLGYGFHSLQNVNMQFTLASGNDFYVFVDIDYEQTYLDEYTVSVSGESPVCMAPQRGFESFLSQAANKEQFIKCLLFAAAQAPNQLATSHNVKTAFEQNAYSSKTRGAIKGLHRYYGQALGYVCFVYLNDTPDVTLKETLAPTELSNVYAYIPQPQSKLVAPLLLPPNSVEVVVLKFGAKDNCSHVSRIKSSYELHF